MARLFNSLILICLIAGCRSIRTLPQYNRAEISWVNIEGGRFIMGDTFTRLNEDALPVHRVDVKSFKMSRFETSFEQYDAYARRMEIPRPMPDDSNRGRRAVSDISWDEAVAFCESVGGRLPSETEWEYAAAGGAAKQLYAGTSDSLSVDLFASYRENSKGEAFPVGNKAPNEFGLYDMSGNVAEWIGEYYQSYPENAVDAVIADTTLFDLRIIRGGSVWAGQPITRTYWRTGTLKEVRTPSVGFRCARD